MGSIGVTRFGKKLNEALFLLATTVAVSIARMPRVPGSLQSGRRFGVTISECPLRQSAIVVPRWSRKRSTVFWWMDLR